MEIVWHCHKQPCHVLLCICASGCVQHLIHGINLQTVRVSNTQQYMAIRRNEKTKLCVRIGQRLFGVHVHFVRHGYDECVCVCVVASICFYWIILRELSHTYVDHHCSICSFVYIAIVPYQSSTKPLPPCSQLSVQQTLLLVKNDELSRQSGFGFAF